MCAITPLMLGGIQRGINARKPFINALRGMVLGNSEAYGNRLRDAERVNGNGLSQVFRNALCITVARIVEQYSKLLSAPAK